MEYHDTRRWAINDFMVHVVAEKSLLVEETHRDAWPTKVTLVERCGRGETPVRSFVLDIEYGRFAAELKRYVQRINRHRTLFCLAETDSDIYVTNQISMFLRRTAAA